MARENEALEQCEKLIVKLNLTMKLIQDENARVSTPNGVGIMVGGNPMKQAVLVEMESKAAIELPLSQVNIINESKTQESTGTSNEEQAAPPAPEPKNDEQKTSRKNEGVFGRTGAGSIPGLY